MTPNLKTENAKRKGLGKMKSLQDIREQIKLEVIHAQSQYIAHGGGNWELAYHPTTKERDGGIMAFSCGIAKGYIKICDVPMGKTAEELATILTNNGTLERLPVLS